MHSRNNPHCTNKAGCRHGKMFFLLNAVLQLLKSKFIVFLLLFLVKNRKVHAFTLVPALIKLDQFTVQFENKMFQGPDPVPFLNSGLAAPFI